ncbi:Uncharacterized protein Adt_11364 [Abeliophyllum distichum]|uniref:Uncharacterized protein n=1 Tax=Abeliophyllum distichum TaxID=126358 RepID=A0ABD1UP44_9LAMI
MDSSDKFLENLCCKQDRVEDLLQDINSKYESLVAMMARMNVNQNDQRNKQVEGASSGTEIQGNEVDIINVPNQRGFNEGSATLNYPRLIFLIFGGNNPREWVRKSNKYF